MSDLMFYGVLRMPYEMAMSDEMSRRQFYSRVQEAVIRVEAAEARLAEIDRATPSPSTAPANSASDNSLNANENMAANWGISASINSVSSTAPIVEVDERAAFEAEQIRHVQEYSLGRHMPFLERTGEGYKNNLVHHAWRGWQARAALASKPAAREATRQSIDTDEFKQVMKILLDAYDEYDEDRPVSDDARKAWAALIAHINTWGARRDGEAVPAGFKLVPVEPTQAMITAGFSRNLELGGAKRSPDETYRAMIGAAPAAGNTAPAQQFDTMDRAQLDALGRQQGK